MGRMMRAAVVTALAAGMVGWAAVPAGMAGDWLTSGGSVVRVAECGQEICLTVVKVSPSAKETMDKLNPDPAMRTRPLCGLRVGDGFVADSDKAASGGKIYDPESGKTYNGKLEMKGTDLKLRGFVGVSLFGRTETWKKVGTVEACH